jgi:hypothetical protein
MKYAKFEERKDEGVRGVDYTKYKLVPYIKTNTCPTGIHYPIKRMHVVPPGLVCVYI